jgi:hypothetical protein
MRTAERLKASKEGTQPTNNLNNFILIRNASCLVI